jgi:2-polyprenyl-6-methoxyphenol hydroxylase-like FAD-dependent oxidoreductase
MALEVLVIGGGLGGLCLAHGLRRRGIGVTVFERDAGPDLRGQGYRLHMDGRAASGLERCLPADLFELYRATLSRPTTKVTVLSAQMRTLRVLEVPATASASADRLTLRQILLSGLGHAVRFGARCTGYETLPGGRIRAHLAGGGSADGDVLVGADGAGSVVRRQYLPQARVVDTGVRCVYGRTPLAGLDLPGPLWDGFCPVSDLRRLGLALGLVQFPEPPAAAAARLAPGVRLTAGEDYVMWSLAARRGVLGRDDDLFARGPAALHALAAEAVAGWHPQLRAIVDRATAAATFAVAVRSAIPINSWTPTPVTLLGDAIHAMAPSQGSGANLALLDAAELAEALAAGGPAAIGGYEAAMTRTGFAAVRASRKAARRGPLELVGSLLHRGRA